MRKDRILLLVVAFISGFSIMSMEISAARLVAPYFGNSIYTWANIISVVMLSISMGYYFGGEISDRKPELTLLLKIIFSAGLLLLIIPFSVKYLVAIIDLITSQSQIVSSLIFAIILFFTPLFLLGVVSPFIIKLYLLKDANIGKSVGLISAISTVGSILGTYLPTFYLIPTIGTFSTISTIASLLVILGSFGFKNKKIILMGVFFLISMILFFGKIAISTDASTIFEDESSYQYIKVSKDNAGLNLTVNEGFGVESTFSNNSIFTGHYYDYFNILPYLANSNNSPNILIIGLSGGTMARQFSYFFPKAAIDGVEIDPEIINVARKYFDVDKTNAKIYNFDGRMFLRNSSKKYDLIIVDAYAQEFYVPWTLTTNEFWNIVNSRLNPNGIVALNVNALNTNSELLKAISNTIANVFPSSYMTDLENGEMNYILLGSHGDIYLSRLDEISDGNELYEIALKYKNKTQKIYFDKKIPILTDDKAPIEQMTDSMIKEYFKKY